jgi:3',5'-cyclic AMP phosphodiesterase CpdA
MTLLLQVSDPHFGTERPEVVEALVELALQRRPDVLVLSGDITQRARRRQFAAALRFCERLAVPRWLVLPGNHDIPLYDVFTRVFAPYRLYRRAFGADFAPLLDLGDLLVIGVNTTRRYRHKHGEVSAAQIAAVATRLREAAPGQLRIVVTHQPVDLPPERDQNNLLRGRDDAVPAWVGAGVDLILGGHIHLPFVRPLGSSFPALHRRAWCVQAGTAVSHRTRAEVGNSVNFVGTDLAGGRALVERWDYRSGVGFVPVDRHDLELDRS